ncbi:hypothetical protein GKQ38_03980 [Candidatus Nanohaloarchaea archaeon]|nr:hypothetical protein GKQ38_03980 [Candidatus Nanohaloarchaea archaeon]
MSLGLEIQNIDREVDTEFSDVDKPGFSEVEPDIDEILEKAERQDCESLVVIGNGGSITSFRALYYAFIDEVEIDVHMVTTQEPDYLHRVASSTDSENTLVMPISKSGRTTSVLESLLYFIERDYPVFAVTSDNDGTLREVVDRNDYEWIEHKDVGGRFSGLTETALMPAAVCGIDVDEVRAGGEEIYDKFNQGPNPAWKLAQSLYSAEKEGYDQILTPFYTTRLFGFYPLTVQLMHETVCKEGEGQSVFGDLGPEYQHHTNQRLFGGERDIVPLFVKSNAHRHSKLEVPENLQDIDLRGRDLGELDGETFGSALESEYTGVKHALQDEERPFTVLSAESVDYRNVGRLMAFLQYLAVYSAELRGVDPYSQPDVEKSKEKGFQMRFK